MAPEHKRILEIDHPEKEVETGQKKEWTKPQLTHLAVGDTGANPGYGYDGDGGMANSNPS